MTKKKEKKVKKVKMPIYRTKEEREHYAKNGLPYPDQMTRLDESMGDDNPNNQPRTRQAKSSKDNLINYWKTLLMLTLSGRTSTEEATERLIGSINSEPTLDEVEEKLRESDGAIRDLIMGTKIKLEGRIENNINNALHSYK